MELPIWYFTIGVIVGIVSFILMMVYTFYSADDIVEIMLIGLLNLMLSAVVGIGWPIAVVLLVLIGISYGIYRVVYNFDDIRYFVVEKYQDYLNNRNKIKKQNIKQEQKQSQSYKEMLQEAIESLSKYCVNLSSTRLTTEGKGIVLAVTASIEQLAKIISNAKTERISFDVFEKAYNAIKANRIELQRAESLVSMDIENQLEQEIKLMRATLPQKGR